MPQGQKPLCPIYFWVIFVFSFSALAVSSLPLSGVIMNWTSQYERLKGGNFLQQNQFNRLQMVQFECPKYRIPESHSILGDSFFPFSAPAASSLLLSGVIRNWTSHYERLWGGIFFEQNQFNRLQMVQLECPRVRNPYMLVLMVARIATIPWLVLENLRWTRAWKPGESLNPGVTSPEVHFATSQNDCEMGLS